MIFNRQIQEFIAIDGRDDPSLRESAPSIGDCPIVDWWSGCVHVFCVREYVNLFHSSDLHCAIEIKSECPLIANNRSRYNSRLTVTIYTLKWLIGTWLILDPVDLGSTGSTRVIHHDSIGRSTLTWKWSFSRTLQKLKKHYAYIMYDD